MPRGALTQLIQQLATGERRCGSQTSVASALIAGEIGISATPCAAKRDTDAGIKVIPKPAATKTRMDSVCSS